MEIEQRTPMMAKKLWSIIRVMLYMMTKSISKNIPWFEIHMMLKRSTKLAGKAIGNLLLDHHQTFSSALTCRPNNIHNTFIQPLEYEFSFTNTPLFHLKRKNKRHLFNHTVKNSYHHRSNSNQNHNEFSVNNVKRVFDILNSYENHYETTSFGEQEMVKSPLTLLGFGESGNVRQLRVTDSPFPVNNNEEDTLQVDKAAEEFIKNFYNELKQQKKRAAVEPPSPLPAYQKWGHLR